MTIIIYKVSFRKEAMAQIGKLLETECAITIQFICKFHGSSDKVTFL